MKKISAPVLFDTNIFINFKGQLKFIFQFFDNIMIHKKVYDEVLEQSIKNELDSLKSTYNITFVEDKFPADDIGKKLLTECDKELKNSFNIENLKDMGEYKTLLYAKFNGICILSSQDTTVWRFIAESKHFKGLQCITVQDMAYLLYLNANGKSDRKIAKALYKHFTRNEHPFEYFITYMKRNNDEIPGYIEFESTRINNFEQLVQGYMECYSDTLCSSSDDIEYEISKLAAANVGNCLSCLYSRVNKNNINCSIRKCLFDFELNSKQCIDVRDEFTMKIRGRVK